MRMIANNQLFLIEESNNLYDTNLDYERRSLGITKY